MKKTIMYLGKRFGLMLGIFLFTSIIPAFGQETVTYDVFIKETGEHLKELDNILTKLSNLSDINNLEGAMKKNPLSPQNLLENWNENVKSWLDQFRKTYTDVRGKYIALGIDVNIGMKKNEIEVVSLRYTHMYEKPQEISIPLEERIMLNKKLINPWDISQSEHSHDFYFSRPCRTTIEREIPITQAFDHYRTYGLIDDRMKDIEYFVMYFRPKIKEMSELIEVDTKISNYLVREVVSPLSVMEYAYKNGMLPKERAGVKLTLEAMDADVALGTLVKNIRTYLTEFGTKIKDVKFSAASLTRELKGMTLAERTEYVNELTDLEKGSKTFIEDFGKLDRPAKRYVGKSITKGFWVLAGLGAIATAAYITDVAADNHFSKNTISTMDLGIIAKNIENGTATIREKFAFFTHPATEEYVKKDPVYTLNFVQLVSDIYAADELLQEAQKTQGQQIKENVENSVLKNLDKQIGKTEFGVGSL